MNRNTSEVERRLADTLTELITQKPYAEITIKELVLTAQVSRSSFYRHYTCIDDLLLACMSRELKGLAEELAKTGTATNYDVAVSYFRFWEKKQSFVKALRENGLLSMFQANYEQLMFEVAQDAKPEAEDVDPATAPPMFKYIYYYGMHGLWGVANRWILFGCKETPEQLASYICMYFTNAALTEPSVKQYLESGTFPFPEDAWAMYLS